MMWKLLKNKQLGYKFRRQHSIGNYILDFYCPDKKFAIELDGEVHNQANVEHYDSERDKYLAGMGIHVMRIENELLFTNAHLLGQAILNEMENR